MTDMTPTPLTPPTCSAAWTARPGRDAGACTRPALWSITGLAADEAVVTTLLSCDDSTHRAWCMQRAWEHYATHHVSLRLITPLVRPRGGV